MGIELEEMTTASCTGAGVLQEKDLRLGDILNAHTLALAEQQGLPIMTICSTCQGVMSQANHRLTTEPGYLDDINRVLAEEGLSYRGTTTVKHFVWILLEDVGEEKLRQAVKRPLTGLRAAPFYGCYIQRPSAALGFDEQPARAQSLETVMALCWVPRWWISPARPDAAACRYLPLTNPARCRWLPIIRPMPKSTERT